MLQDECVTTGKLQSGAVNSDKIAPRAVGTVQLKENAIASAHIQPASVLGHHLQARSIPETALAFSPVQGPSGSPSAKQLFGATAFAFKAQDEQIELTISFSEPLGSDEFAIVAMTNHPACYASLKERTKQSATFYIVRTKFCPAPSGTLTWIAIGAKS